MNIVNALTVDVEAWYHAEIVRHRVPETERLRQVEEALAPLRHLFRRQGVRATFFFVGEILRRHPALVRALHDEGHEIAFHTMSHRPLHKMGEQAFRAEIAAFAELTGDVLGEGFSPVGFRAPTFSLNQHTNWAIRALSEAGYRYDSSIFPLRTPLYGVDRCPPVPYRLSPEDVTRDSEKSSLLWEFPLPVLPVGPLKVPLAGGFYLRLFPLSLLLWGLRRLNADGIPFTLYVHPWETYPGTPHVANLSPQDSFITYHNIDGTLLKLAGILNRFRFAPMEKALGAYLESRGEEG